MSDSEGEASFASADEGDGVDKGIGTRKKEPASSNIVNKQGEARSVGKAGDGEPERKDTSAGTQSKKDGEKGRVKQQQQQGVAKGKGSNQTAQKDVKTKTSPLDGKITRVLPGAKSSKTSTDFQEIQKPEGKRIGVVKDSGSTPEKLLEAAREAPKDKPTEATRETPKDKPTEATRETLKDKPTEATRETPKDKPREAKREAPKDKPTEATREAPKEKPTEATREALKDKPTESKREAPKDKLTEATKEAPKYIATNLKDAERLERNVEPSKPTLKGKRTEVPERKRQDLSKSETVQESPAATQGRDVGPVSQPQVYSPAGQNIPRGQLDHTLQQEEILMKLGESTDKGSGKGWGWSNWGSSLLSAATNSVQTFTSQVGDGFSTIMETVESSLGVPDPEEIVKAQEAVEPTPTSEELPTVISQPDDGKQEVKAKVSPVSAESKTERTEEEEGIEENLKSEMREEGGKGVGEGWFSGWSMADLARKVQDTGKSLASKGHSLVSDGFDAVENLAAGGIDVLENIGKKTYNTLSEHDPAFRKTREFLTPKVNKPNLSSILKEAKDKAEYEAVQARENEESRKAHFGTLFDNYQGIAHLEALEILSNQSEKKVHSLLNALTSSDLAKIKPTLISIKEAFEVSEEENDNPQEQDFPSLVSQYVSELQLGTAPDKLNRVHEMVKKWIVEFDSHDFHETGSMKDVHEKSIQALAELTAKGVEQFHKAGELVLFERDTDKDCMERAHSLVRLTGVLCHEIGNLASKFAEILNKMADEGNHQDEVTPLVTNVYLEATNSSTYIQDAFQLLLPVLQHAALEHSILSRQS